MIHFSKARLKTGVGGSTGALVSYLSANSRDIGASHQLIWSLFPDMRDADTAEDGTGSGRPFIFRMTGATLREDVLIYSDMPPEDNHSLWDIETKPFSPAFMAGDRLRFSIRLNPTVTAGGKRRDIIQHARVGSAEAKQMDRDELAGQLVPDWLASRLSVRGLQPIKADGGWIMTVSSYMTHRFRRKDGGTAALATADVTGLVEVVDPALVLRTILDGIGRGRAFGCGMLLLKQA